MTRTSRTLGVLLGSAAAFALAWTRVPCASADDGSLDVAAAERAFAVGDLDARRGERIETSDDVARAIAWLRDTVWRPGPESAMRVDFDPADRATAWAVKLASWAGTPASSPPPVPSADPFPVITALVLDRVRREREGRHSTRDDGPLAAVATHEDVGAFLNGWVPAAYGGPAASTDVDTAEAHRHAAAIRDAAVRSRWIAAAAVGGLGILAALAGWLGGRTRRRIEPASA